MNDVATALGRLGELAVEVHSWAYGHSGTRLRVFGTPGTPGTPGTVQEKIADSAKECADGLGVGVGTIDPNTFQDGKRAASILGEPCAVVSSSSEVATYLPFGHCPPFIVASSAHS